MRFATPLILTALALPLAACQKDGMRSAGDDALPAPALSATLADEAGAGRGTARIEQDGGMLRVRVSAIGIAPGVHGVHLHAVGKCEAPGFASAGGHWNPTNMKHGKDAPAGPHGGDLPNMTVAADGTGTLDAKLPNGTLSGVMDADGTAIIIHAGPDDYVTDPSGNSGGRVACGVLTQG